MNNIFKNLNPFKKTPIKEEVFQSSTAAESSSGSSPLDDLSYYNISTENQFSNKINIDKNTINKITREYETIKTIFFDELLLKISYLKVVSEKCKSQCYAAVCDDIDENKYCMDIKDMIELGQKSLIDAKCSKPSFIPEYYSEIKNSLSTTSSSINVQMINQICTISLSLIINIEILFKLYFNDYKNLSHTNTDYGKVKELLNIYNNYMNYNINAVVQSPLKASKPKPTSNSNNSLLNKERPLLFSEFSNGESNIDLSNQSFLENKNNSDVLKKKQEIENELQLILYDEKVLALGGRLRRKYKNKSKRKYKNKSKRKYKNKSKRKYKNKSKRKYKNKSRRNRL
jgi:hypothetical protein